MKKRITSMLFLILVSVISLHAQAIIPYPLPNPDYIDVSVERM